MVRNRWRRHPSIPPVRVIDYKSNENSTSVASSEVVLPTWNEKSRSRECIQPMHANTSKGNNKHRREQTQDNCKASKGSN